MVIVLFEEKKVSIIVNRKKVEINIDSILYILMNRKIAEIHILGGEILNTRTTFSELLAKLDERFLIVCRGCVVSVMAIHKITKKVELNTGEFLDYTIRKKKYLISELKSKKQKVLNGIVNKKYVLSNEEYQRYYASFDNLPFAFADIEMVFNNDRRAVDWIFRYGNEALAKFEKTPLNELIGNSFGKVFPNMDSKWLICYERVVLYGETIETMDYSPEIDTNIKVICFPTFKGHCGCILFNLDDIRYIKNSYHADKIMIDYFGINE